MTTAGHYFVAALVPGEVIAAGYSVVFAIVVGTLVLLTRTRERVARLEGLVEALIADQLRRRSGLASGEAGDSAVSRCQPQEQERKDSSR